MKLLDPDDPFFRHPATRWLTVILPLAWGGVELWNNQLLWGAAFIAAGLYAGWMLFFRRGKD